MNTINTTKTTNFQDKAIETSKHYIDLANELYNLNLPLIIISFKMKGRSAGVFVKHPTKGLTIKYNRILLEENGEKFISRTIPHEIAHYIAYKKYNGRVKSHGWEWKRIMRDFGCDTKRCHSYDTSNSRQYKKPRKKFVYTCNCMVHHMSSIKHKRILEGTIYRCTKYKTELKKDKIKLDFDLDLTPVLC